MSDESVEIAIPEMHKSLAKRVAELGNEKLREEFLSNESDFYRRMEERGRGGPSLQRLRRYWNPLEPRLKPGNRIVMRIKPNDIWWITFEERKQIQVMVMEAAMEAIMMNREDFVTAIVNDAISKEPKLKYG